MSEAVAIPAVPFKLAHGSHGHTFKGEACVMELVSLLAGEPFSDAPRCASPIVRRRLNDRLDDERRQLLRPFALRSIGTAGDGREEERRQMCNVPYGSSRYWAIREPVYNKVYAIYKAKAEEIIGPVNAQLLPSALDLLDRMLPAEPLAGLAVPVEVARVVCGIEAA